jgi:ribonuclease D
VPERIYDTQIAARLIGFRRFGLAHLIEHFFEVTISKSPQKADWGKRPLTEKMIEYAFNDVRYLPEMIRTLTEKLHELGRWEWFLQSCDDARKNVIERESRPREDAWKITGWGKLSPLGMAFLRAIWNWRDRQAEILDRPAFKVMNNERMIDLSLALESGKKIVTPPGRYRPAQVSNFKEAVEAVYQLDKSDWPQKVRGKRSRPDPEGAKRFDKLKAHRDKQADAYDLEASLIAPKHVLERLAFAQDPPEELLLPWQREVLGL